MAAEVMKCVAGNPSKRRRKHASCERKWSKQPQTIRTLDGVFSVMVWAPGNPLFIKILGNFIDL